MALQEDFIWQGVLIEESLDTDSIPSVIHVIETKITTLEKEAKRGAFHFHSVEVSDEELDIAISFIITHIKPSWYFHLVKGEEIIVMFYNHVLNAHKGNDKELEAVKAYGISQGIHPEQLEIEKLFDNPFA